MLLDAHVTTPTSIYGCKRCKASYLVLKIPFKEQKPTMTLFGEDSTCCFAKNTSHDHEKTFSSLKNFFRKSQSTATEHEPRNKNYSVWRLSTVSSHWLRNWARFSTFDSLHRFSTYIQATLSSQFSKKESSGLLTLVQTLSFWLQKISYNKWQQVPAKFFGQLGNCCCPKDKNLWTIIWPKSIPLQPTK